MYQVKDVVSTAQPPAKEKPRPLKVKVENMISPGRGGGDVPNQFIITTEDGRYFQSYSSVIAFINTDGEVFLDKNKWDYSVTTGKYRNIFLGKDKKETERHIKSGTYTLVNLNPKE